jgi:hypothetical protein
MIDTEQRFTDTVLLLTQEGMGSADLSLQRKLLDTYLRLLLEANDLPAVICFYTEGVKLVVEGSPLLKTLSEVEAKGVRLVVCATCLDYLGLTTAIQVGMIGGMTDIIEAQRRATKLITL